MNSFRGKILSGLFWQYLQRLSTQGIQLVISIILARLLLPKDFGVVALIGVFITVSGVLIDSGFSNALIQKKDVDQKDYASVFLLNIALACILYIILFFSAPFVAGFYNEPLLTSILRVISLTIILNAATIIQTALLSRGMFFRKSFNVNLASTIFSGFVGIYMAYNGYGVWSLVFSQLASKIVSTTLLWYYISWTPSIYFSFNRVKVLFNYGSKILLGYLFNAVYNNVYSLIIGKQYSSTTLGYYNRGALVPTLIVDNISNTLGAVMFPVLSAHQNDKVVIKQIVSKMLLNSSSVIFFIMAVLILIAKPLIIIVLTDKWLPSVPYLQLVCITVAFYPLHAINAAALTSIGESGSYLKITIINKSLSLILIIASIPFGVMAMVSAGAVGSFISTFISAWPNKNAIGYSSNEQWRGVLPGLLLSIVSVSLAWPIEKLKLTNWLTIISQVGLSSFVFVTGAFLFKFQLISDIKQIIKSKNPV